MHIGALNSLKAFGTFEPVFSRSGKQAGGRALTATEAYGEREGFREAMRAEAGRIMDNCSFGPESLKKARELFVDKMVKAALLRAQDPWETLEKKKDKEAEIFKLKRAEPPKKSLYAQQLAAAAKGESLKDKEPYGTDGEIPAPSPIEVVELLPCAGTDASPPGLDAQGGGLNSAPAYNASGGKSPL